MYIPNIPTPEKRITEFEKLGFGMFIHYGLYSQVAKGEWIYWMTDRNMEEYKKLADTFTAENFNAEELVLAAKRGGCKYVNLTTRHHEGFSLYDTRGLCDFNSLNAPSKRDLVLEFVEACNKHDMVPFLYHTTLDWYQESFENNFDEYLEYLRASVEVLCRNYGKIGGFFFDGNWIKPHADWKLDELYGTIRKYQPDAMIINNTGLHALGRSGHPEIDSVTFEQNNAHPIDRDGMKKYLAAETCMTMNTHWGYAADDYNYKSPADLIRSLCTCRTAGANYLLNVSPDTKGALPEYQKMLLSLVGDWIEKYSEAIYNVEPMYYPNNPGSCSTVKTVISRDKDAVYFYVFDLGKIGDKNVTVDGKYAGIVGFSNFNYPVERIEWLDSGEELKFTQGDDTSLSVNFTGHKYGYDYCVRIAKAYLK